MRIEMPDLRDLPLTVGQPTRPDLRVATILDPFSEVAFAGEFSSFALDPASWRATLDEHEPNLLLVESAWRGADDRWRHHLTGPDSPSEPLRELVAECRRRDIPTIFWNKEDPPNYDVFIDSAKLFDQVFTVDEGSLPRYERDLGGSGAEILPFAAQPQLHNPLLGPAGRDLDVAFAGTYYVEKHPHRKVQMMQVVEPAREFGLHIYSRFGDAMAYRFPPPLDEHVVGQLSYGQTLDAYRRYRVLLNVNSSPKSETMCARRVFEILACGGVVLSGRSPAIDRFIGPGVVPQSDDPDVTRDHLRALLEDADGREQVARRGALEVLRHHTYRQRVRTILEQVGLPDEVREPRLEVRLSGRGGDADADLLRALSTQTLAPDLVTVDEGTPDAAALREAVRRVGLPSASDGAEPELVATLSAGTGYDDDHLAEQVAALSYAPDAAVAKPSDPADAHRAAVTRWRPGTLVARRSASADGRFEDVTQVTATSSLGANAGRGG